MIRWNGFYYKPLRDLITSIHIFLAAIFNRSWIEQDPIGKGRSASESRLGRNAAPAVFYSGWAVEDRGLSAPRLKRWWFCGELGEKGERGAK